MANKLACGALGVLCSLLLVGGISATRAAYGQEAQNPVQRPAIANPSLGASEEFIIDLRLGFASLYKTERPFASIVVGDPKIVEVNALTDRTMTLIPTANGLTNILFLDAKGEQVSAVEVLVTEAGPSRVKIHNKALLTSATIYRCSPTFCEYTDELTAKEPAPTPPTRQIIEQRGSGPGGGGVSVSVPPPASAPSQP
jgi:hypothetical protein